MQQYAREFKYKKQRNHSINLRIFPKPVHEASKSNHITLQNLKRGIQVAKNSKSWKINPIHHLIERNLDILINNNLKNLLVSPL